MEPILRAEGPSKPLKPREVIAQCMSFGMTRAQAKLEYRRLRGLEWWGNDQYSASVDRDCNMHTLGPTARVVHISVHRRDRAPVTDWRHMQEIKNAVIGAEAEAVSIHPAESRVVDTANEFHLFAAFDRASNTPLAVPMGFPNGMKQSKSGGGAVQRPLDGANHREGKRT